MPVQLSFVAVKRLWSLVLLWFQVHLTSGDQLPLGHGNALGKTVKLDVVNCWRWMYTTEFALGNPPKHFRAAIETAVSDVMVPSVNCAEPQYCDKHPLYNSSESSTYVANGTGARVGNGLYYSRGYASSDSYYVGDIEVRGQTFEEAIVLRPSYFLPESWHDSTLALSRQIVYNDEFSNLSAPSPFQNMVEQGSLAEDMFSLKLPRKVNETGFLLLGGRDEDRYPQPGIRIPLLPDAYKRKNDEEFYQSGGWEVEPVYLHFGTPGNEDEIYYDLYGYAAAFTTWPPCTLFPRTFTEWVFKHIGVANGDSTLKCKDIPSALPNITIALRGVGGSVEEFVLTYEDYALDQVRPPDLEDEDCQLLLGGLDETGDGPKFILLGPQFLRRHYTTFDEGGKQIILSRLP